MNLELERDDKDISVTVFAKALSKFLKKDVTTFKDEDQLMGILLTMEESTFTFQRTENLSHQLHTIPNPKTLTKSRMMRQMISVPACLKNSTGNTPD